MEVPNLTHHLILTLLDLKSQVIIPVMLINRLILCIGTENIILQQHTLFTTLNQKSDLISQTSKMIIRRLKQENLYTG
jgi:hypothetical protein